MATPFYHLAVAYRVCPYNSKHASPVHPTDKLSLVKLCAQSFKAACGSLKVKMFVVMDDCTEEYRNVFKELWDEVDLEFKPCYNQGDSLTFKISVLSMLQQTNALKVGLIEDDYLWVPNSLLDVCEILNQEDVDFVTPYYHPDIDTTEIHKTGLNYSQKIRNGFSWISCNSTTHTFFCRQVVLEESKSVWLGDYNKISPDLAKWMALTKTNIFNPFKFIKYCFTNKFWAASIVLAWYYCLEQIILGRRYKLWVCYPSKATHMVAGMLAKEVDWTAVVLKI